jgi:quercetin dioxygenase-like cupin family protein
MDHAQFRQQLQAEGFDEIVDKSLPAGQFVATHSHPFAVKALVTAGEVSLEVGGTTTRYGVGEVFSMAKDCAHAERYGESGVSYVVGRKHA